jgi:hypothetical protein
MGGLFSLSLFSPFVLRCLMVLRVYLQCDVEGKTGTFGLCDIHPWAGPHGVHPVARSPLHPVNINDTVLDAVTHSTAAQTLKLFAIGALHEQQQAAELAHNAWLAGFQASRDESQAPTPMTE